MSELKKYKHEVSSLLECSDKEKEYYLSIIENDFGDEADKLSYEELVDRLGSPQEWVDAHLDIVGGTVYENKIAKLKKKRNVLTLIITIVALLIAAVTIYICATNDTSRGFKGDYGEPTIISTYVINNTKGNQS